MLTISEVPSDKKCRACKQRSRVAASERKDERRHGIWECVNCGCRYQGPVPRPAIKEKPRVQKRALTPFDRVQAALRHPQYQQEAEAFLKTLREGAARDIDALVDNPVDKAWGLPSGTIYEASLSRNSFVSRFAALGLYADGYARRMMVKGIRDARYLSLEIDLLQPIAETLRLVQAELEHYRAVCQIRTATRNKESNLDLWDVYDRVKNSKQNFSQITKSLFRTKGNPATDVAVARQYKQVERAYRKACEMIRAVRPAGI